MLLPLAQESGPYNCLMLKYMLYHTVLDIYFELGLFPLLWCSPSENSNYKPRTRTTTTNYWKLHSTSLVAFCSSLTHCSTFIPLSKTAYKLANIFRGNPAQCISISFLFWILIPQVLTDSEALQCLQTDFFH